jgi:hypothetical protein
VLFLTFAVDKNELLAEKVCDNDEKLDTDTGSEGWSKNEKREFEERSVQLPRLTWEPTSRFSASDSDDHLNCDNIVIGSSFMNCDVVSA